MSKLTINNFFQAGDDWTEGEIHFYAEHLHPDKAVYDNLSEGTKSLILAALHGLAIKDKFGQQSCLYRDWKAGMEQSVPGFEERQYRDQVLSAAKGYQNLAGSTEDALHIFKKNPKLSQLAALRSLSGRRCHEIHKALKAEDTMPSASDITAFQKRGYFPVDKEHRKLLQAEEAKAATQLQQEDECLEQQPAPSHQTIDVMSSRVSEPPEEAEQESTEETITNLLSEYQPQEEPLDTAKPLVYELDDLVNQVRAFHQMYCDASIEERRSCRVQLDNLHKVLDRMTY